MTDAIPVIDIEGLWSRSAAERRFTASEVGRACRDIGFFTIRGHGVPDALIDRTFAASRELFALPDEVKQSLGADARGPRPSGYVGPIKNTLGAAVAADFKESFNLGGADGSGGSATVWPPIAGWRDAVQSYFDALLRVGSALHRAFALDLGWDVRCFDDKIGRQHATLRMFRYPAAWGAPTTTAPSASDAGIHTDASSLTLVAAGDVGRLQMLHRDGRWIDVPALDGAFVCNVGDCLMRWSNGLYVSSPHRVLPPQKERYSIAFFLDGAPVAMPGPRAPLRRRAVAPPALS